MGCGYSKKVYHRSLQKAAALKCHDNRAESNHSDEIISPGITDASQVNNQQRTALLAAYLAAGGDGEARAIFDASEARSRAATEPANDRAGKDGTFKAQRVSYSSKGVEVSVNTFRGRGCRKHKPTPESSQGTGVD